MKSKCGFFLFAAVVLAAGILPCGGCGEGIRGSDIYTNAILGGVVGGIVGHQMHERDAGIAIGAVLFGLGEYLDQIDDQIDRQNAPETPPVVQTTPIRETYIIDIHNENGSVTPVRIRKRGDVYIGPNDERYDELPTEEQLAPIYGLQ